MSAPPAASVHGALLRYRVMAFVVGVTLLVFCGAMIGKYVFQVGSDTVVAIAHGWLFMLYALLGLDLAFRMRWSLGRMFVMVVSGMIPFASFVVERKVVQWVGAQLEASDPTTTTATATGTGTGTATESPTA